MALRANLLSLWEVERMRLQILWLAALVACSSEDTSTALDSGNPVEIGAWSETVESEDRRYTLSLERSPDPPTLGDFTLGMDIRQNSDNPCFDGAILVGAGVEIEGRRVGGGGRVRSVEAEELSPGHYEGTWSFAQSGDWRFEIEVGIEEDKDIAVIWMNVGQ